jgi:ribosomal protein S18 acetylase RimI-like enzyme
MDAAGGKTVPRDWPCGLARRPCMQLNTLRPFTPVDLRHLSEICLRTGDRGNDASASCTHPELLGDYFAVPYAMHDPTLCLVLTDAAGPCGYILGAADTRAFVTWFNQYWLPDLRAKYRGFEVRADACDSWLVRALAEDAKVPACADEFPAHLHIDLLPRAQGAGWGRKLVHAWMDLAAAKGARGFHLGVSKENRRAVAFYERFGLQRLRDDGGAWLYGMRLPRGVTA